MNTTQIYAIAAGSLLCLLILINFRRWIVFGWNRAMILSLKYLVYPQLLSRHRWVGPWNPSGIIMELLYGGVNIFCVCFKVRSVWMASLRAANLSLINLVPLMAGPHLSFPADLLGINLCTYRKFHRSAGLMSSMLLAFHILIVLGEKKPFPLHISENLFGMIGAISWGSLMPLAHPLLRRPSYEIFLRVHQILAIIATYSIWEHLKKSSFLPQTYIYITIGILLVTTLLQCGIIICKTGVVRRGFAKVKITNITEIQRGGVLINLEALRLQVTLASPLKVKAGQYICLWIPWFGVLQSHPFAIASWSDENLQFLDIFVQPRAGLTGKLLRYAKPEFPGRTSYRALFSGPHGTNVPAGTYETVLMIADGFGIVSLLPYLKQLIYEYNACKIRTRRIHLVWQLKTPDLGYAAVDLLNEALEGDTLSLSDNPSDASGIKPAKGKILSISIYIQGVTSNKDFGERATVYSGLADLETIVEEEAKGKYIKRVQEESDKQEGTLVMVSGSGNIRDQLRKEVRRLVDKKVRLEELEYQPVE